MARPTRVPTNAPAIPSNIVMMMPPGSRPGMMSLARAPTTNPTISVQRMFMCASSIEPSAGDKPDSSTMPIPWAMRAGSSDYSYLKWIPRVAVPVGAAILRWSNGAGRTAQALRASARGSHSQPVGRFRQARAQLSGKRDQTPVDRGDAGLAGQSHRELEFAPQQLQHMRHSLLTRHRQSPQASTTNQH